MLRIPPESAFVRPQLQNFTNSDEINSVMERLHKIPTRKNSTKYNVMFCAVAFGDISKRFAFLDCIKYALDPTLTHSAYLKPIESQEFEVVVMSTKKVEMKVLEEWLDTFNMSVCFIEFQDYMQPDMVSCISRIHHLGNMRETNFGFKIATKIRRDFHREHNKKQKAMQAQRLLDETGLHFTMENMFALHVRVQQQRGTIQRLQEELLAERAAVERWRRCGREVASIATEQAAAESIAQAQALPA
jgi:hypothetical protein